MRKFYKLLSAFIAAALMTASMSAAVFADGENDSQPANTEAAGIGTTVTETTDTETTDTETTDTETTDTETTDTETTENVSGDLEDTDFGDIEIVEDDSDKLATDMLNIMSVYEEGDAQAVVDVLAEKDKAYRQVLLDQIQTESADMYNDVMAIYNAVPEIVSLENYDSYYISGKEQATILRTSMNANGKALSGYFQFSVTGEAQTGTDVAEKTAEFKFNVGQLDGSSVLMSGEAEYVFGMLVPGVCFTGDVDYTSEYTKSAE